jgi:RHS repeat-associated protein
VHDSLNNRVLSDGKPIVLNSLNQVVHYDNEAYAYDVNGNLALKGDVAFEYDALDRLIRVIKPNETYRYTYDAFNRRLTKEHHQNGELVSCERFLYQGDNEIGSFEGTRATLRVLGLGLGAEIGAAVFIDIDGVIFSPVHDHSGHLINLIAAGTERLLASYQYSAFGVVEKHDGLDSPWQFSSKRVDPETGWIYFGRRYYDPTLGRWTTCDPKGYSEGDNLYAYVYNNPLTLFDLFGLFDGYWDMDADEAAMYDRDAYMEGFNYTMSTLAGGARDFLFGSTYELGASVHSEFWGNPNDPNRTIPISQRCWAQMGL